MRRNDLAATGMPRKHWHPCCQEQVGGTSVDARENWGGNNGSTATACIIANRERMTWMTKEGERSANYFGSMTHSSTERLGNTAAGQDVNIPLCNRLPMVFTSDLVVGGWDISKMTSGDAMRHSKVLDWNLQEKLRPRMESLVPLPSTYLRTSSPPIRASVRTTSSRTG